VVIDQLDFILNRSQFINRVKLTLRPEIGAFLAHFSSFGYFFLWYGSFHDDLNGEVVGYAGDCYSKGPRFESRVSHGPFQKV
jgi:hypothetical protein